MSRVITGRELRSHRTLRGMSQQDAADLLGVGQKTVANWEAGSVPPSREAQVRDAIIFSDAAELVRAIPTVILAAEVTRRLTAAEPRSADLWLGASPPRRTRRPRDTPDPAT